MAKSTETIRPNLLPVVFAIFPKRRMLKGYQDRSIFLSSPSGRKIKVEFPATALDHRITHEIFTESGY